MSLRAVLLLQGYLVLAAAMYFQLGEQEEKCIIEEIPVDTLVTGESFSAHESGQHFFCFQTNSTRFSVFAGEKLRGQMINILRQQEYQREKEESFRQISEDTNSKVLWWALMQTFILLSVGFWQMKRLKEFFIAKKLV